MRTEISINRARVGYFPKVAVELMGFSGKVPCYINGRVIALIHPEASLDEVRASLDFILKEFEMIQK